jgi:glucose-6-phosphate isomerase, archaeal
MIRMDWGRGYLRRDPQVRETVKTLLQLRGIFANQQAWEKMDPRAVVYRVQAWCPVPEGTEGGLFWGTTVIEPGRVGAEYFITHGHFHVKRDRSEYYGTTQGEGALILMDETRKTWMERMSPGSLHFIPPNTAHRVANVGKVPLRFLSCWPSDAGHDYETIRKHGFSARLFNVKGRPRLVGSDA